MIRNDKKVDETQGNQRKKHKPRRVPAPKTSFYNSLKRASSFRAPKHNIEPLTFLSDNFHFHL